MSHFTEHELTYYTVYTCFLELHQSQLHMHILLQEALKVGHSNFLYKNYIPMENIKIIAHELIQLLYHVLNYRCDIHIQYSHSIVIPQGVGHGDIRMPLK